MHVPNWSAAQWLVCALALSGGIGWLLRLGVQFGMPLQSEIKFVDGLLAFLNGFAGHPNAQLARLPPPKPERSPAALAELRQPTGKKNPVIGAAVKSSHNPHSLPMLLVGFSIVASFGCAWFQNKGAPEAGACAVKTTENAIISIVTAGAIDWEGQLSGYAVATVNCVLQAWLTGLTSTASLGADQVRSVHRANMWLANHPDAGPWTPVSTLPVKAADPK